MNLHPAEEATIRAFVVPQRRERLLSLLGNRKRRKVALDSLNHFDSWDQRYVHPLPSSVDMMVDVLRRAGAPEECHVISDDPAIDGRDMTLDDAVAAAEAFSFASVLCCLLGAVACFFDESAAPRTRILLQRAAR